MTADMPTLLIKTKITKQIIEISLSSWEPGSSKDYRFGLWANFRCEFAGLSCERAIFPFGSYFLRDYRVEGVPQFTSVDLGGIPGRAARGWNRGKRRHRRRRRWDPSKRHSWELVLYDNRCFPNFRHSDLQPRLSVKNVPIARPSPFAIPPAIPCPCFPPNPNPSNLTFLILY